MPLAALMEGGFMGENRDIQLNLSKRKVIYNGLKNNKTAKEIGDILGLHKTTISREVKKYRYLSFLGDNNPSICSTCNKSSSCKLKHKCGRMICSGICLGCKSLKSCDAYVEIKCHIETRFPFVCFNCKFINICKRNHYLYSPEKADEEASKIRRESRIGINMNEKQYNEFNDIIQKGVKQGQSLYHIYSSNDLGRCIKSLYNYVNQGKISVKPIDLPRAVTLKQRKTSMPSEYQYDENKEIDRSHHMYSDWLVFQAKHRIIVYWEMDFLGAPQKSEQMIMSLIIPQFQFAYLIPFNKPTKEDVKIKFEELDKILGTDFEKVFEAILTDRDPRFNCFKEIEVRKDATIRTRVFFCDPGASNEKPFVENLNQQIRVIFPKGSILSNITKELCDEISSNLNSRFLNSIDGKRPIDLFIEYFGIEVLDKLNLKIIEPNDVKILRYDKY